MNGGKAAKTLPFPTKMPPDSVIACALRKNR